MGKAELTKNSAIIFAATSVSSLCTFIFHVMMGRSMTLDYFGQFSALISVQFIFSVFAGALILLYTRHAAKLWTLGELGTLHWIYMHAWRVMAVAGLACGALIILSSLAWRTTLNIESVTMVMMAALLIAVYFLQSVPLAFVRGLQKFQMFGIGLTSAGILKLVLGALFIYTGITVSNALLAVILAVLLSIVLMHRMLWPLIKNGAPKKLEMDKSENRHFYLRALAGTFFPVFFVNIDMILVRSLFTPEESGQYAAFMVIGKVIFLFGSVLAIAIFPATVSLDIMKKQKGNDLLYRAMVLLLIGGGAVLIPTLLYPAKILFLLFKIESNGAAQLLPYYCASMLAVSLLMIEAHFRLARQQYDFLWVVAAAAVIQVVGIIAFSYSLAYIIKFQMALFWVAFAVRFVSNMFEQKTAAEGVVEP